MSVELLARNTPGMSGAELSNLVNEASLAAARQEGPHISAHMLDMALDKISMGTERRCADRHESIATEAGLHAFVLRC